MNVKTIASASLFAVLNKIGEDTARALLEKLLRVDADRWRGKTG